MFICEYANMFICVQSYIVICEYAFIVICLCSVGDGVFRKQSFCYAGCKNHAKGGGWGAFHIICMNSLNYLQKIITKFFTMELSGKFTVQSIICK